MSRAILQNWAAALVVLLPASTFASNFNFKPYLAYEESIGSRPETVVVGDVTGDGRDDVILGNPYFVDTGTSCNLFMYAQRSNGALAAPVQLRYLQTDDCNLLQMQIADLNRDGLKDIIVGHDYGITVLIARGLLRFESKVTSLPGDSVAGLGLVSGDLDGDGWTDIVRQAGDGTLSILLGDGAGGFRSVHSQSAITGWRQALRIAEVTGDGFTDLVMANQLSMAVYPGAGDGHFLPPRIYPVENNIRGYSSLAVADINFDGRNDILAATSANPPNSHIWIYANTASGALSKPRGLATYSLAEALTVVDVDHNGYPDIVTAHGGHYALGYFLQGPGGWAPEAANWIPYATHYSQHGLATGDLDGDGCTDVAIADYNNGLIVLHGQNCLEPLEAASHHQGDFDGDGISDVLWHNAASGQSVIWRSGDASTQSPMTRLNDSRWLIAGIYDFDGDGKSDVLWRHASSGANAIWFAGDLRQNKALTRVPDAGWQVAGLGDFDGDAKGDILWHHKYSGASAIWGGALHSQGRSVRTIADTDWKIIGVGDFDGNGKSDILWRNVLSGRNTIWLDGNYQTQQAMDSVTDVSWQVAGLGDFDNDGCTDILWRHASFGRNVIWLGGGGMNRRSIASQTNLTWKVSGIGDYTNDGRADILWRNNRTGTNLIWRDADYRSVLPLARMANMGWKAAR